MASISKTLVIRFSSIGDIVLSAPLLRSLRLRFPQSQIDYLTRTDFADLVRFNQNLNFTYTFDRAQGVRGLWKLALKLRRERYDLVVDIHHSLRSRIVRLIAGAPQTVVIDKRLRERRLLVKHKVNRYTANVSVADRYIETIGRFGVQRDGRGLELHIPDEIRARTSSRLAALSLDRFEHVMGMCPGARHATKRWPEERYRALGIHLGKSARAAILVFGGEEDRQRCEDIVRGINEDAGSRRAFSLAGELSLLETAAAMEYCDVIVSNDTGLMHIAAAMQRTVIALFGSTVREFGFFPLGESSIVIERPEVRCRPCSHIGRASCPEGHFRCMRDISVGQVADVIEERLKMEKPLR